MEDGSEFQFQFNYLSGSSGSRQLYYDFQLWYCIRENYWGCIDPNCNSYLQTLGDSVKNSKKPLPLHNHDRRCTFIVTTI